VEYVIRYGKKTETTQLDNNGSFVVSESTIMDYQPVDQRQKFEIRVKVHSDQEELTEFLKFRTETKKMRNAEFRIEHTNKANQEGAWYVVKIYTIRPEDY
jgi:hypothetical protein